MVLIPGHRARFGGVSVTGGADSGTPGTIRRGFRDRWCGRRDTGAAELEPEPKPEPTPEPELNLPAVISKPKYKRKESGSIPNS